MGVSYHHLVLTLWHLILKRLALSVQKSAAQGLRVSRTIILADDHSFRLTEVCSWARVRWHQGCWIFPSFRSHLLTGLTSDAACPAAGFCKARYASEIL